LIKITEIIKNPFSEIKWCFKLATVVIEILKMH